MVLTDNILAYYKLDETSGTTVTDAVGNYNLTNSGATINQSGKIGTAYLFGDEKYLYRASTPAASTGDDLSINCWIKNPTGSHVSARLISLHTSGYQHYFTVGNGLFGFNGRGQAPDGALNTSWSSPTWTTDTWFMITYVFSHSGGDLTISSYINGSFHDSDTFASKSLLAWDGLRVGKLHVETSQDWTGVADEIGIWNIALDSTAVTELYNSGNGLTYPFSVAPEAAPLKIFDVRFG